MWITQPRSFSFQLNFNCHWFSFCVYFWNLLSKSSIFNGLLNSSAVNHEFGKKSMRISKGSESSLSTLLYYKLVGFYRQDTGNRFIFSIQQMISRDKYCPLLKSTTHKVLLGDLSSHCHLWSCTNQACLKIFCWL